jgi:uncharacterized RDD family membrane protein YckC
METTYPDLKTRVQSTFIDTMLMVALMFAFATILEKINPGQEGEDGAIRAILFISVWGLYEPVAMTIGCTLGNYMMKIRSRQFNDDKKRINIFQAFLRFVVKVLLGWLSFITISSNKERRAIHDFAAGSVMINK